MRPHQDSAEGSLLSRGVPGSDLSMVVLDRGDDDNLSLRAIVVNWLLVLGGLLVS